MKLYHHGDYTVRKLLPLDWKAFKAMRLEAAKNEPNVFVRPYEEEAKTTDKEWQDRLKDIHRLYLGLFDHDEMIGLSGIAFHSHDPSVGVMVASYIRIPHRGKGLSNLFYQARIDWALRKGLRKLIVSHHKGNDASRAAIQKHHFLPTHRELKKWPDGSEDEQLFYELDMQKWKDVI
jgi:RimJ/RimL family protein N-acetyltransferase